MCAFALSLIAALGAAAPATGARADTPPAAAVAGLQRAVAFDAYPPFADTREMLRRLMSPLAAARAAAQAGIGRDAGTVLRVLDPARQRFALYVPKGPPPAGGYALLVFVPPWDDARVPTQWMPVLDRTHTAFVTAAGSGNDADVFNRREPLALIAAWNVGQRYRIDPSRVYVGGFSGGSRVALRLALAYPDVFRGALLDAGSDPIGTAAVPLPPESLLHRFQQSSRVVFVTGDADEIRQAQLARAATALDAWCVYGVDRVTLLHTGHELADAAGLSRGLAALAGPPHVDADRLARCRTRNQADIAAALGEVRTLIDAHRAAAAQVSLDALDARYGGLAAPASFDLQRRLTPDTAPPLPQPRGARP